MSSSVAYYGFEGAQRRRKAGKVQQNLLTHNSTVVRETEVNGHAIHR